VRHAELPRDVGRTGLGRARPPSSIAGPFPKFSDEQQIISGCP
jgi:hypothetical protein